MVFGSKKEKINDRLSLVRRSRR